MFCNTCGSQFCINPVRLYYPVECPTCESSKGSFSIITTSNSSPPNNVANQPQQLGGKDLVVRYITRENVNELFYDLGMRGFSDKQKSVIENWCERNNVK